MIKKRTLILTVILLISIFNSNGGTVDQLFLEDPTSAVDKVSQTPIPAEDLTTQISGTGKISQVTPASTGSLSGGVNLQDIIGSYDVLVVTGKIIGGVIVSPKDNNAVTTFNPLTGEIIVYHMDKGDTVLIDYSEGPAYKAKMSEGVEAEIQTKNKIRFTAYGKDSLLKIKPTEEPSYEFNNGLLEYENDKILEQVNTSKTNDASVDKDYTYGFKCLTIAPEADYNYVDKNEDFRSFRVRNKNRDDYQVCLEKTAYDQYEQIGDFNSLFNIQDGYSKLKATVNFEKDDKPVYEGLDRFNIAELSSDRIKKIASFKITNTRSNNGVLSKVYTGQHVIVEERQGKIVNRYHQFSNEKYPNMIREYSSDLRFSKLPDIKIEDGILVQEGKNKFTALTPDTTKFGICEDLLEKALEYKGYGDEFDEKC